MAVFLKTATAVAWFVVAAGALAQAGRQRLSGFAKTDETERRSVGAGHGVLLRQTGAIVEGPCGMPRFAS